LLQLSTHAPKLAQDRNVSSPHSAGLRNRLKHWYIVAAVGLLNAILLLLVLNLALYAVLRLRHPAPRPAPAVNFTQHNDPRRLQAAYPGWREQDVSDLLRETPRADREFEYEPLTGFRERPFRGRFVNIDPAGFRYSKNQAPWPPQPGATNVFLFGGSTAFGYYLPDDQTIPSWLQQCAAARNARPPLAVYNFARPAYISTQELALFQQLLRAGHVPTVAIFIDGLNDFIFSDGVPKFTAELRGFMNGETASNPLNSLPMVRAAHWLSNRWSGTAASAPPEKVPDYADATVLGRVTSRWLANRKMIEAAAAAFGVRTVFVWQPIPVYDYDLRYHLFLHSDSEFGGFIRAKYGYAVMNGLREQGLLGPDVLWLADMQRDRHENLYVDSVHYNAAFSAEIAARIYDFLEKPGSR